MKMVWSILRPEGARVATSAIVSAGYSTPTHQNIEQFSRSILKVVVEDHEVPSVIRLIQEVMFSKGFRDFQSFVCPVVE